MKTYLSSTEVVEQSGLSYRQLHYWCSLGVFGERLAARSGSGGRLLFDVEDLEVAKVLGRIYGTTAHGWVQFGTGFYRRVADHVRAEHPASRIVLDLGPGVRLLVAPA